MLALDKRTHVLIDFDLTSNSLTEEEAICGGVAKILIDGSPEIHRQIFQDVSDSLKKGKSGVLATFIEVYPDNSVSISRYWMEQDKINGLDSHLSEVLAQEDVQKSLSRNRPVLRLMKKNLQNSCNENIHYLFLEPVFPPSQLVIAGAGHIGKALAHLGHLLNFEVTVIDDRVEYANSGNLPDADWIIVDDIGTALKNMSITSDSYIVIVTRGHRHDSDALRNCISRPAPYIGMIGSKRRIKACFIRFRDEDGISEELLNKVHAPIGLDIGSETPEEIALSIIAEMIKVRRGGSGQSLTKH